MINFPKKILVAKNNTGVTNATVCPVGKTSGEKKKVESLRSSKYLQEYDNIPLPGFTLQEDGAYYKDVWPVIDPRGFVVYIDRVNLNKILSVTGITEGLIQQQCVWARDNSGITMTLIPVTAREYDQFVENTELLDNKPSLKDISIGDEVKLQNELVGIYRGCFNLHGPMLSDSDFDMSLQVMSKRHIIEVNNSWFYHSSNPSIVRIIEKTKEQISKEDTVEFLNDRIAKGAFFSTSASTSLTQYWSTRGMVKLVTLSKDEPTLELVLDDIKHFESYTQSMKRLGTIEYDRYILEDSRGIKYALEYKYGGCDIGYVYVSEIASIRNNSIKFNTTTGSSRYGPTKVSSLMTISNFTKCYRLIKKINQTEQF